MAKHKDLYRTFSLILIASEREMTINSHLIYISHLNVVQVLFLDCPGTSKSHFSLFFFFLVLSYFKLPKGDLYSIGSISAAFSRPVFEPPEVRREEHGLVSRTAAGSRA